MRIPAVPWLGPVREVVVAHRNWEMLVMRLLLATALWHALDWHDAFAGQDHPRGLARLVDVTWFGDASVMTMLRWTILLPLAAYVAGLAPVVVIPLILAVTIPLGSLENSQGSIEHSDQLFSLMLLGHWAVVVWRRWRGDRGRWWWPGLATDRAGIHGAKVMLAAGYVVSGVTKLLNSDFRWIIKVPDIALGLIKTNVARYYDALTYEPGWRANDLPRLIYEHPHLARLFFGTGLVLELVAFLILCGRRWSLVTGLALIAMHAAIWAAMGLRFPENITLLAAFAVNAPGLALTLRRNPTTNNI